MSHTSRRVLLLFALLLVGVRSDRALRAAQNDDNVEWFGVFSHPVWRQPRHPAGGAAGGEPAAFTVELRVFRGDITAARVRTWDGKEGRLAMSWVRNEGAFDIWRARVPGTDSDYLYYRFEIQDGDDVDYYNALGMSDDEPSRGDFFVSLTPHGAHPLGATVVPGGAVFRVWAPNASAASVAGTFNDWSSSRHPLSGNRGFWEGFVSGARAGDEYKFVFDGELWRTDPRSRRQVDSAGNSVIVDPDAFSWSDADWRTPPLGELILYELHVGSFSGEGDGVDHYPGRFRDIIDTHLDHLVELGVNAVELMPLGEFAGELSWGYNPVFFFAPESAYGSPEDLKVLVDRCHQDGIAVVLDVVFNHMGPGDLAGNLLEYDGEEIYFYPENSPFRETPWGPRPDYGRTEVRNYIRDSIESWIREYHIDGFRLDGTDFIKVNGDGWQLLKDIAQTVEVVAPDAIVCAEQLPNDPAVSRPIELGGAGADCQWSDAFHDSLRQAIRDAAFGDPDLGAVAAGLDHFALGGGEQVVNYIESHDEAHVAGRVSVEADGADPNGPWAAGRARVAAALVLYASGVPMLLQGQEFLESRRFGDAREDRIDWRKRDANAGFLRFFQDAIRLRRTRPALRASASQNVYHVNDEAEVLAFRRLAPTTIFEEGFDDVVVVVSLSSSDFARYDLGFPQPGVWFEILNGDSRLYGGDDLGNGGQVDANGPSLHGLPASATITIPRMGVLVFARRRLSADAGGFLRGDCDGNARVEVADVVDLLNILFLGSTAPDCLTACDGNGDSRVDIGDPVYLLFHEFVGGSPPPAPWPTCGREAAHEECDARCAGG